MSQAELSEPNKSKMVAKQSDGKVEMIASLTKIKVLRPIALADGTMAQVGSIIEVEEKDAKEFCDKTFQGSYSFAGERIGDNTRNDIVRAVRVA